MGNSHRHDNREADLLNLGTEHIPFPCSLRELVLDRYAEPPGAGANAHPMSLEELVEYLKEIDDFSVSPWVAVMEKTEAIGDPAAPSREHNAILRWLGKALEIWEKEFPLEGRLANQVRRLKPLAAALALSDAKFLQPGAHPLHQLLDTLQARAIGWQSRLDRVGTALEEQVTLAVDSSRQWFEDPATNLTLICSEFASAAERDQARAQRMVQRVVDTETGKVRTAAAKQEAARMINTLLENYPAPTEIGTFLKGPWYSSAQLLLLKFGMDSDHWRNMTATTETLLDSLQSLEDADDKRRQHIFELVTQLPKEMRRWLLSLHHDTEAVNEAMGMVEFVHLRILRQQPVELERIEPIEVDGELASEGAARHSNAMKKWSEGQWFLIKSDGSLLRVQLVLKIEQSQQLLFANMAGLKVLELSFEAFSQLLFDKQAAPLLSGASFSLSLARAAGVNSVEILEALTSAMAGSEAESAPEPEPESAPEPAPDPAPQSEPASFQAGADTSSEFTSDFLPVEDADPFQSAELPVDESLQAPDLGDIEFENVDIAPQDSPQPAHEPQVESAGGDPDETPPAGDSDELSDFERETRRFLSDDTPGKSQQEGTALEQPDETVPYTPSEQQPDQSNVQARRIDLPVGVWIGFHDGETPVMARLAVHDPHEDHFIFVNRKGVKIRQVSGEEFLDLIDRKLVEILETSTNFRDVVTEVRKNLD